MAGFEVKAGNRVTLLCGVSRENAALAHAGYLSAVEANPKKTVLLRFETGGVTTDLMDSRAAGQPTAEQILAYVNAWLGLQATLYDILRTQDGE